MLTLRAKISLIYILFFSVFLSLFSVVFYLFIYRSTFESLDKNLRLFFHEMYRIYSLSPEEKAGFISLAGQEGIGFEFYKNGRLLLAYGVSPGFFNSIKEKLDGFENFSIYRVYSEKTEEGNIDLIVGKNLVETEDFLKRFGFLLFLSVCGTNVFIFFLGKKLSKRLLQPLSEIGKKLGEISSGDIEGERINVKYTGKEIKILSDEINLALSRLERYISETKDFSSILAHELRTPLSIVKSTLELVLLEEAIEDNERMKIEKALDDVKKTIRFSNDLLSLSKIQKGISGKMKNYDFSQIWLDKIEDILVLYPEVEMNLDIEPDIFILCIPDLLERMIFNIIENAVIHSIEKKIEISVFQKEGKIFSNVSNSGDEVKYNELVKALNKEFRGKISINEKNSLGILIAKSIAQHHGIKISSNFLNGRIKINLEK